MSRTRLTRQIQHFCQIIRRAKAEGLTPEAWIAQNPPPARSPESPTSPSRRQLLATLAALPVASLVTSGLTGILSAPVVSSLTGCTADETPEPDPLLPVVVVGAGMAGMNACHRLAQAGVRAEVYEARDRVGGRMITGRGLFGDLLGLDGANLETELGAEFVNSTDEELLLLVQELGLDLIDLTENYDLEDVYYFAGAPVTMRDLLPGLRTLTDAADAALASFTGEISYQNPAGAARLDATSAREWLDGLELDEVTRAYAEVVVISDYGSTLDEMSALDPIYFFSTDGYPYDERYGIRGGNDQVPRLLADRYADQLHLNHALTALEHEGDGWKLTFHTVDAEGKPTGSEVVVKAEAVIMTLPFSTLRSVQLPDDLPEIKRLAIDTLGYGTNAKLVLAVNERFWLNQGQNGYVATDLPLSMGWDSCVGQAGTVGTWSNYLSAAQGVALAEGSTANQKLSLVTQLSQIWPDVAQYVVGDGYRMCWPADPWMKGSYACYLKGQYTGIGGAEAEPVGTLHFAGEHTSRDFQGYMNGAAQTGRDAAEAVLAQRSGVASAPYTPRACLRRGRNGRRTTG